MEYATFVASETLALVFLIAGVGKIVSRRTFMATLTELDVPKQLVRPLAGIVVVAELCTAAALLLMPVWLSSLAVITLLVPFVAAAVIGLRRAEPIACACFGSSTEPLGLRTIIRAAMMGLGVLFIVETSPSFALPTYPHNPGDALVATVTSISILLVGAWLLAVPSLFALIRSRRRRDRLQANPGHLAVLNGRVL